MARAFEKKDECKGAKRRTQKEDEASGERPRCQFFEVHCGVFKAPVIFHETSFSISAPPFRLYKTIIMPLLFDANHEFPTAP